jgi:hypothetical protein
MSAASPRVKCILVFAFFLSAAAFGQTAQEMEALLESEEATLGEAARFILAASGAIPAELSGDEALLAAWNEASAWFKKPGAPEDAAKMKDVSLMIMKAFNFKGGAMWRAAKSPRYAFRELVYKKIILGRAAPNMKISGQRFLQILGRALTASGTEEDPPL